MRKSIVLVAGLFPQLSETFIVRKALALAAAGANVTVMTRQLGDFDLFGGRSKFAALRIRTLPPDSRLRGRRALHAVASLRSIGGTSIERIARLWSSSASIEDGRERMLHVYRHLPFLDVEADLLHFEFLGLAAMYTDAGALIGAPTVVSCRGSDLHLFAQQPADTRRRHLAVLQTASAVHCVSQAMADEVVKLRGNTNGVFVNRPAVDPTAIIPNPDRHNRRVKIIAVGRMVWIKAFDYLLAAFAVLDREGCDFEAELVGDGPLRTSLQFSLMELGIEHRVRMLGALTPDETISRLRDADIFALSSHNEGISNAALEAMAAGLPVVTTDAGGMVEAVRDGIDGFVVRKREVAQLADRLRRLVEDPGLRARMGESARQRVLDEFSLSHQASRFIRAYDALLGEPR